MRSVSSHETEGSHLSRIVNVPYIRSSSYTSGTGQGGRYPRWSRVWPFSLIPPSPPHPNTRYREHGFSFHPRTKSRIVTPVVSQLGQSYLIKSSRGRFSSLPFPSSFPLLALPLFLQVLIKLFLLLRLRRVFIISRSFRAHSEPQNRYQDLTN